MNNYAHPNRCDAIKTCHLSLRPIHTEKGAAPHSFRLTHEEICTKIQKNAKKNVILQSL